MSRFCLTLTAGLSITLAAACSQSNEPDIASPSSGATAPAPKAELEEDASAIVVTGQRMPRPVMDAPVAISVVGSEYIASAPPPPQARQMVVTGSAIRGPHPDRMTPWYQDIGRDKFTSTPENAFRIALDEPVSTFSIDVDTASYSFVRASLNGNALPQPAAVRTEEMINYFPYDYASPRTAQQPFSSNVAVFPSPFTAGRKLVRIGIKGYEIERATRPHANLVFLIDTSGSMNAPNKLPLVKKSLGLLLDQLDRNDSVSIVTYAGSAGTALEPTAASQKERILAVIDQLGAGGSTAGAEGIRQAYALAERNRDPNGVNRVILATDGDFNVGITDREELKGYVERERGKGIFLSVLGFGMGNYNDALMQTLAQNGNGAAAYIDTLGEARKTLVDEATSTLFPIAKDVKIQVEFNPAIVAEYRLIGYETRMLNRDDFDNDRVDAGDVGSGQTVTALYEIVPVGGPRTMVDLRYSKPAPRPAAVASSEYGFVKIRYKLPKSDRSQLISTPIDRRVEVARFADAPQDARFATGVAAFAELLRGGRYTGSLTYDDVLQIVGAARGTDDFGYRMELVQMVRAAKTAGSMARLDR